MIFKRIFLGLFFLLILTSVGLSKEISLYRDFPLYPAEEVSRIADKNLDYLDFKFVKPNTETPEFGQYSPGSLEEAREYIEKNAPLFGWHLLEKSKEIKPSQQAYIKENLGKTFIIRINFSTISANVETTQGCFNYNYDQLSYNFTFQEKGLEIKP